MLPKVARRERGETNARLTVRLTRLQGCFETSGGDVSPQVRAVRVDIGGSRADRIGDVDVPNTIASRSLGAREGASTRKLNLEAGIPTIKVSGFSVNFLLEKAIFH